MTVRAPAGWRPGNVPLPEPHLVAVALGAILHGLRPVALPGPRRGRRVLGAAVAAAGAALIVRALGAAGPLELARPRRLVVSGAYARSRNPMYVGWAALHLGGGLLTGSGWVAVTLPAAAAWMHRQVRGEEQMLAEIFGAEFTRYRASVPRYLSARRRPSNT